MGDGPALTGPGRAFKAELPDLFVRQAPFDAKMLPVGGAQGQHTQQHGQRLMDLLRAGPLGQRHIRNWLRLGPGRVLPSGGAHLQRVADLPIRLRIANAVGLTVEGQHPAALAAVVAAPGVDLRVEAQLAPPVAADGAVGVNHAGLAPPPDVQSEEGGHVHDVEGKIRPTGHRGQLLS